MEGKWEKRKAKRDGEENVFSLAWMREEKGEEKKVGDNAPFHPQLFSPHKERYGEIPYFFLAKICHHIKTCINTHDNLKGCKQIFPIKMSKWKSTQLMHEFFGTHNSILTTITHLTKKHFYKFFNL